MAGEARPTRQVIDTADAHYQVDIDAPLGKGGFGTVYKALNLQTGDFVAIKQIRLHQIPVDQLNGIMSEIDLLKKLRHVHIVKYLGYSRTSACLNIVLEFMESGSLASLLKRFGQLPEELVGRYMVQVLDGLKYLHEQGVIHRDIKGANILTAKDGHVKLADFGIATNVGAADRGGEASVVGTPYWMAPEVIELSGAAPAADVWAVGATVIELLSGAPPYFDLPPMSALFRIVQDDHPPLPAAVSAPVRDFLLQCFIKEASLRPSAPRLLRHAWLTASRRPATDTAASLAALESAPSVSAGSGAGNKSGSEERDEEGAWDLDFADTEKLQERVAQGAVAGQAAEAAWDHTPDSRSASFAGLALPLPPPHNRGSGSGSGSGSGHVRRASTSSAFDDEADFSSAHSDSPRRVNAHAHAPSTTSGVSLNVPTIAATSTFTSASTSTMATGRTRPAELNRWREEEEEAGEGLYGELVQLKLRPSSTVILPSVSTESLQDVDPFEGVDEDEEHAAEKSLAAQVVKRMDLVRQAGEATSTEPVGIEAAEDLLRTLTAHAEQTRLYVNAAGHLPVLHLLQPLPLSAALLRSRVRLFNAFASEERPDVQEQLCLVGCVPALLRLLSREQAKAVRVEAARGVRQLCFSKAPSVVEMLVACRGLSAMADLLAGAADYTEQRELVLLAVDCLHRAFHQPSLHVPKAELGAQLTLQHALPARIVEAVRGTAGDAENAEAYLSRLLDLAMLLARSHAAAKRGLTALPTLKRLLAQLPRLSVPHAVQLLKALKYLSADGATLPALHRAGALAACRTLLAEQMGVFNDASAQLLPTLYNLLRIDRARQEEAAKLGLVPLLLPYAAADSSLKQFALPVLVDLASVPAAHTRLWDVSMLDFYVELCSDAYWQLPALEALLSWAAEDEKAAIAVASTSAANDALCRTVERLPLASLPRALNALLRLSLQSPLLPSLQALIPTFLRLFGHPSLPTADRVLILRLVKLFVEAAPSLAQLLKSYPLVAFAAALDKDKAVLVQELGAQLRAQLLKGTSS